MMRGDDLQQAGMFSYLSPEQRVPQDHPLRAIRKIADAVFVELSPQFDKLYARMGRPSIAPEKLLRALLLQVLYSVRSERLLMEELDYNMLFRWFVGLNMEERVWDPTTFTKNRERLLRGDIAEQFFAGVLDQAREHELLSDEHFTVDGTLLEAAASLKSFKSKDETDAPPPDDLGNPTVNFHGQNRSNKKVDPKHQFFSSLLDKLMRAADFSEQISSAFRSFTSRAFMRQSAMIMRAMIALVTCRLRGPNLSLLTGSHMSSMKFPSVFVFQRATFPGQVHQEQVLS
jgi:transposase